MMVSYKYPYELQMVRVWGLGKVLTKDEGQSTAIPESQPKRPWTLFGRLDSVLQSTDVLKAICYSQEISAKVCK